MKHESESFTVSDEYVDEWGRRWKNHVLSVQSFGGFEVLTHPVGAECQICDIKSEGKTE